MEAAAGKRRGLSLGLLRRGGSSGAATPESSGPAASAAPPRRERVTVKCPKCGTGFSAEGVRPIALSCPECGHGGTLR